MHPALLFFVVLSVALPLCFAPFWWGSAMGAIAVRLTPLPATALILTLIEREGEWQSAGFSGGEAHLSGVRISDGYSRTHVYLPNGVEAPMTWRCRAQVRHAWRKRGKAVERAKVDDGLLAMANNIIAQSEMRS